MDVFRLAVSLFGSLFVTMATAFKLDLCVITHGLK